MIILESTDAGYTFIGDDNNYYVCIDNLDCNAVDEAFLLELGPHVGWDQLSRVEDWDECPF